MLQRKDVCELNFKDVYRLTSEIWDQDGRQETVMSVQWEELVVSHL